MNGIHLYLAWPDERNVFTYCRATRSWESRPYARVCTSPDFRARFLLGARVARAVGYRGRRAREIGLAVAQARYPAPPDLVDLESFKREAPCGPGPGSDLYPAVALKGMLLRGITG